MKRKKIDKKLTLNKKTIALLTDNEMNTVVGGATFLQSCESFNFDNCFSFYDTVCGMYICEITFMNSMCICVN